MTTAVETRKTQVSDPVTPVDPAARPAHDNKSLASLHAGRVIGGRYILSSRLAIGGMGEVWRAIDDQTSEPVALKVLRPELAGQELFLSRLRIEAANASKLHHPNLAQVYNSGEEDGLGWIAMELVEGTPLTQILTDNPTLPIDFLLSVMMQTANALDTVHRAGIVHRDIKPGNIMVTPQGMVKLTDFGISRATNQVTLTAAGMVMGTAQYLPPEQAVGNPATPAGDLYALGVIAYESLAGRRPFTGKRQVDIAFAHVNKPVPKLPDSVPQPLADLVMDLLEKDPRRRPPSALALGDRIEQVMAQLGISFARSPEDVEAAAAAAKEADRQAQEQARAIREAELADEAGEVVPVAAEAAEAVPAAAEAAVPQPVAEAPASAAAAEVERPEFVEPAPIIEQSEDTLAPAEQAQAPGAEDEAERERYAPAVYESAESTESAESAESVESQPAEAVQPAAAEAPQVAAAPAAATEAAQPAQTEAPSGEAA